MISFLIAINVNKEDKEKRRRKNSIYFKRKTKINFSNMNRFESTLTRIGSESRLNQMVKSCLEAQVLFQFYAEFR